MQQVTSRPQANPNIGPINGGNSRSTIIAVLALLLFALSGLLTGFATGAFTHPKQIQTVLVNKIKPSPTTIVVQTQTPNPNATATPEVSKLSLPAVTHYNYAETADNTTNYTVSAYPIDQTTGKQAHVADITCKVWLTNDENATKTLLNSQDKLRSLDAVAGVLPTEIQNGLTFSTSQTQSCNANGPTTWTYTVSPSVNPGKYFLMILVDWKGNVYNWIARQITVVKKAS